MNADDQMIELREAARQFYNKTIGDETVRIVTRSHPQKNSVNDAANRLRAALIATREQPK